jgi:polyhydroxyalkanoate synthase subunit PhaC
LMWDNAIFEDNMKVAGRPARLSAITAPFMHIVAEHDHIVPYEASKPLVPMIGSTDKQEVMLKGGHVSLVAGPNAARRLWPKLDLWLQERSV